MNELLYCSFCGRSQHERRRLIAGIGAWICDECVEIADAMCREDQCYDERRPLVKYEPGSHLKHNDG